MTEHSEQVRRSRRAGEASPQVAAPRTAASAERSSPRGELGDLSAALNQSPRVRALAQLQQAADRSPRVAQLAALAAQLQGRPAAASTAQRHTPVPCSPVAGTGAAQRQGAAEAGGVAQLWDRTTETPNRTGLPDALKAGIEARSGLSMDDVRVHRDSPKPAQLQALAYAQGTDIHLGPGQEHHLPHEAWHVVQQKQGRVRPTTQFKGVEINDDDGLEREATIQGLSSMRSSQVSDTLSHGTTRAWASDGGAIAQRVKYATSDGEDVELRSPKEAKLHSKAFDTIYAAADEQGRASIDEIFAEPDPYASLDAFLQAAYMRSLSGRMTEGDFIASRSLRLSRSDSRENLLDVDKTKLHESLQQRNIKMAKDTKATTDNFVRMAISIDYRIGGPGEYEFKSVDEHLMYSWNSGSMQYGVDASGNYDRSKSDLSSHIVDLIKSDDTVTDVRTLSNEGLPSIPYARTDFIEQGIFASFSKLTSASGSERKEKEDVEKIVAAASMQGYEPRPYTTKGKKPAPRVKLFKEGEEPKDLSRTKANELFKIPKSDIPVPDDPSDILVRGEPHNHSEVAVAADEQIQNKIDVAVSSARARIPPDGTIVNVTLAANSHPNTMCMNFCRSALQKISKEFSDRPLASANKIGEVKGDKDGPGKSASDLGSYGGAISARFGYVLQVSATKLFGKSMIHGYDSGDMDSTPLVYGRRTAIEAGPSALPPTTTEVKRKPSKKRKEMSSSIDDLQGGVSVTDGLKKTKKTPEK